ncbi:MAG: GNAT family N-acetyltransferase [Saprospiraceae bacterium]|nr:GNAT family N-acetyltransferase [Saprospiraceae bacterium]
MVKYNNCPSHNILGQLLPVWFKQPHKPEPVKEAKFEWYSTTHSAISFAVFKEIDYIYDFWQFELAENNLLLEYTYLKNLEKEPVKDYQPFYFLFRKQDRIIGLAYAQLIHVSLLENLQWTKSGTFTHRLKKWLAGKMSFNFFVCGNTMFTGEHGFIFDESLIERETFVGILSDSMDYYAQNMLSQKVHLLGLKDLDVDSQILRSRGYAIDPFLPNMNLNLPEVWDTMDDYLDALSSKYRVRAKRAFKKAKDIAFIELTEAQIRQYQARIIQLYREVVSKAVFNVVSVPDSYFLDFKRSFPEEFRLFACFDHQEVIGFYTSFKNGKDLEAHYLGFDLGKNRKYQLYLNMLYKLIAVGIEERVEKVIFGRTSMAIKSSVGAEAVHPYNYVRHTKGFMNQCLPAILKYFSPKENWEPRHPFKSANVSDRQNG